MTLLEVFVVEPCRSSLPAADEVGELKADRFTTATANAIGKAERIVGFYRYDAHGRRAEFAAVGWVFAAVVVWALVFIVIIGGGSEQWNAGKSEHSSRRSLFTRSLSS